MRRRAFEEDVDGLISPLVDVVFNAMAAMFIFLILYIVIVRPNDPLTIHTRSLPDAVWFRDYESGISVTGGSGAVDFEVVGGTLPRGVELDARTGRLFGNPRPEPGSSMESRTFAFRIAVEAGKEERAEAAYEWTMRPSAWPFDEEEHPLRFEADEADLGVVPLGRPLHRQFACLGGIEPYRVELAEGSPPLPEGLLLVGTALEGTPGEAGAYVFDLELLDEQDPFGLLARQGLLPSDRLRVSIEVVEPAPLRLLVRAPRGRVGDDYTGSLGIEGGLGAVEIEVHGTIPGLHWQADSRGFVGSPERPGDYELDFVATDRVATVEESAVVRILPRLPELEIRTRSLGAVRIGEDVEIGLAATGGVPPVTWHCDDLPPGLRVEGGLVVGRLAEGASLGARAIGVVLMDAEERTLERTLTMSVLPARPALRLGVRR